MVAIAFVASSCGGDASRGVVSGTPSPSSSQSPTPFDTRPASSEPAGRLLFYLPAHLPAGYAVQGTSSHPGPSEPVEGTVIVIGRPRGDEYTDVVRVVAAEAPQDREVSDDERGRLREVDVNGTTARLTEHEVVGTVVDWFRDGMSVGVIGSPGATDLVVEVARALDLQRAGAEMLTRIPEGFVRLGAVHSPATPSPGWSLLTRGPGTEFVSLDASVHSAGLAPVLMLGGSGTVAAVTVRGASGAMSTDPIRIPGAMPGAVFVTIAWLERPDVGITVRGPDRSTVLAVAESLREVDEATFRAASPPPPPPPDTAGPLPALTPAPPPPTGG